jgi:TolA-binding protein
VLVFERFLREFGSDPAEPEVLLALAEALLAQNRLAEARQRLELLMARHPNAPAATEALRLMQRVQAR